MQHIKDNQTGFSALEGALVVLLLAIIGGVGVYVYHSQQVSSTLLTAHASIASPKSTAAVSSSNITPISKADKQALQSSLTDATTSATQSDSDSNSATISINDKSTFTSVPQ